MSISKRILSAVVLAVFVLTLALSMTACGQTPKETTPATDATDEAHTHVWAEADCVTSKTCTECGETEGEALGHTLTEATYFEAAVCTVCGEEAGEPKPGYFAENGIPVADALTDHTQDGIMMDPNHREYQVHTDFATHIVDVTTEPDDPGFEKVTLTFTVSGTLVYRDENGHEGYNNVLFDNAIYDYYTGLHFTSKNVMDDSGYDSVTTLNLDGVTYEISSSKSISWNWGKAYDGIYMDFTATSVYTFRVPEGYDGLVYCSAVTDAEGNEDTETESGETYAADRDNLEGCQFFRIRKSEQ